MGLENRGLAALWTLMCRWDGRENGRRPEWQKGRNLDGKARHGRTGWQISAHYVCIMLSMIALPFVADKLVQIKKYWDRFLIAATIDSYLTLTPSSHTFLHHDMLKKVHDSSGTETKLEVSPFT